MINIKRMVCNMLQENTYIVSDETGEAVIIDCGAYWEEERKAIVNYIKGQHLRPVRLISTHGHFDHNFGNDTIYRTFGLKAEVSVADEQLMDLSIQVKEMLGIDYRGEVAPVGNLLGAGDTIVFGNHRLAVIATPGHTKGGVTFYCESEGMAFTGDTLFRGGYGRTDFEGGSWKELSDSLNKVLAKLPASTKVFPGHGETTTIGAEFPFASSPAHRL